MWATAALMAPHEVTASVGHAVAMFVAAIVPRVCTCGREERRRQGLSQRFEKRACITRESSAARGCFQSLRGLLFNIQDLEQS